MARTALARSAGHVVRGVLHLVQGVLRLALGLVHLTLGAAIGIVRDLALHLLGLALDPVLGSAHVGPPMAWLREGPAALRSSRRGVRPPPCGRWRAGRWRRRSRSARSRDRRSCRAGGPRTGPLRGSRR